MGITLIRQGVFVAFFKKHFWMLHEVLIQRIINAYQEGNRSFFPAAATPSLLPGAGYASGITSEHRSIQVADVYAQLQRICGYGAQQLAGKPESVSIDFSMNSFSIFLNSLY